MNKQRRTELTAIAESLSGLKGRLEICANEEREYADNMPENLKDSEKHEQAEENADKLEEACSTIEDALTNINETIEI